MAARQSAPLAAGFFLDVIFFGFADPVILDLAHRPDNGAGNDRKAFFGHIVGDKLVDILAQPFDLAFVVFAGKQGLDHLDRVEAQGHGRAGGLDIRDQTGLGVFEQYFPIDIAGGRLRPFIAV